MNKLLGNNWKTTLAGIGLAILYQVQSGLHDWKSVAVSAGIALLGALSGNASPSTRPVDNNNIYTGK